VRLRPKTVQHAPDPHAIGGRAGAASSVFTGTMPRTQNASKIVFAFAARIALR